MKLTYNYVLQFFRNLTSGSLGLGGVKRRINSGVSFCCVPGTAHVLKGEPNIPARVLLGKSLAQPDGGEGRSAIATGIR